MEQLSPFISVQKAVATRLRFSRDEITVRFAFLSHPSLFKDPFLVFLLSYSSNQSFQLIEEYSILKVTMYILLKMFLYFPIQPLSRPLKPDAKTVR